MAAINNHKNIISYVRDLYVRAFVARLWAADRQIFFDLCWDKQTFPL